MCLDMGFGALIECGGFDGHQPRRGVFGAAVIDGVYALTKHPAAFHRFVTSLSKRYVRIGSEPHPSLTAGAHESE